jgi:hypothetical protein
VTGTDTTEPCLLIAFDSFHGSVPWSDSRIGCRRPLLQTSSPASYGQHKPNSMACVSFKTVSPCGFTPGASRRSVCQMCARFRGNNRKVRANPQSTGCYPASSPRTRPITPVESIRDLPGSWYLRPRRRRAQLVNICRRCRKAAFRCVVVLQLMRDPESR